MQIVRLTGGRMSAAVLAFLLAACGDSSGPDGGVPSTIVTVGGNGQNGRVGSPLPDPLVAEVRDGNARGVAGVSVAFSVTAGGGTVDPAVAVTDAQGRATATWTLGTSTSQEQRVRAQVTQGTSTFSAQFLATPQADVPAALAKTVGDGQTRAAGVALRDSLAVRAQDQFGNPVPGVTVSWAVLLGGGDVSPASSVTGADGVARTQWTMGAQAGTNAAEATAQGLAAVTFSAQAVPPPAITSVSPDTLRPGQVATLTGSNFSALAADNIVRVNNTVAILQSVTGNQVTFTVPCETTGVAQVTLATNGATAESAHPLSGGDPLVLGVGQAVSLGPAELGCNELSAEGARYVVAVVHNVATSGASTSIRLRGATAGATTTNVITAAAADVRLAPTGRERSSARAAVPGLRDQAKHMRMLEEGARLVRQMGSAARPQQPQRSRTGVTAQSAAQTIQIGDTISLRIPDIDAGNLCTVKSTVRARALHVGTHAVVFEDIAAPLAGQMDSAYRAIGDEFENVQYPILRANFGDPLAYDANTDANGKFFMLFSKIVNDFGDVAGFVSPADLLSTTSCASSNEAEIFYGVVPTDAARGFPAGGEDTQDEWRWSMRSVILHEAKHITANAERFQRTTGSLVTLEESWLEESTAMIAEELYGRAVFGYQQNGNTGFDQSVYCERRPDPTRHPQQCWHKPVIMLDHFFYVYQYMRSPETLSPLGRQSDDDATFYGSGWSLVRWLTDHFAPSEAAFLSALIQEPTLRGLENLRSKLGRDIGPLLADWALALTLDDDPSFTPVESIHTLPSWNLRSVYAGLNGDGWSGTNPFPDPFPRGAHGVTFGTFDVSLPAVRGGSAALFELTGPRTGRQLLELTSPGGSTNNLYMKVIRVE